TRLLENCEKLARFLKCEYELHFHITAKGTTSHNICINHCLLYAFGECCQSHSRICDECNTIFEFFAKLKDNSEDDMHEKLAELQDQL
ncbi:25095_t:CDS:1, partial [Racocetra persica]